MQRLADQTTVYIQPDETDYGRLARCLSVSVEQVTIIPETSQFNLVRIARFVVALRVHSVMLMLCTARRYLQEGMSLIFTNTANGLLAYEVAVLDQPLQWPACHVIPDDWEK